MVSAHRNAGLLGRATGREVDGQDPRIFPGAVLHGRRGRIVPEQDELVLAFECRCAGHGRIMAWRIYRPTPILTRPGAPGRPSLPPGPSEPDEPLDPAEHPASSTTS